MLPRSETRASAVEVRAAMSIAGSKIFLFLTDIKFSLQVLPASSTSTFLQIPGSTLSKPFPLLNSSTQSLPPAHRRLSQSFLRRRLVGATHVTR